MGAKKNLPELRRQLRKQKKARAIVYWDSGERGILSTWGECLDISESGMRLQLGESFPRGSYVHVSVGALDFGAFGIVRHSDTRGIIGVEFRPETVEPEQLTRWKALVEAVRAPDKHASGTL